MDGTRLLRRAIKISGYTQADFARIILRTSHRTLSRMLGGEKAVTELAKAKCRVIIKDGGISW